MNVVGINMSKGKGMITVMQPLGVVVADPFKIPHAKSELENWQGF